LEEKIISLCKRKKSISNLDFVKYRGIPIAVSWVSKAKFAEAKVQKRLKEINKLEFNGILINQMLKIIKIIYFRMIYC
jgi:hypothetical protein